MSTKPFAALERAVSLWESHGVFGPGEIEAMKQARGELEAAIELLAAAVIVLNKGSTPRFPTAILACQPKE